MEERRVRFIDGDTEYVIYTGIYKMTAVGAERTWEHPVMGNVSNFFHVNPYTWGRKLLIIGEYYEFQLVKCRKSQAPNWKFSPWKRTAVPLAKFSRIR